MKIGTTLFLEDGEDHYRSRLVEKRDGEWLIDLPVHMRSKRTTFMPEGTRLRVSFAVRAGLYAFDTNIKGRELGRVPMLVLDDPEQDGFYRHQRREFVRIEGSVDVAVHPREERFSPFTTTTVDLSGGGLAIRLLKHHGLKENMVVTCWLVLPRPSSTAYLELPCRVTRIFQPKAEPSSVASLEFVSIQEKERQQIIRYCYDEQLARKKKGLTP